MGCSISSSKKEVYRNTVLPQETRNILGHKSSLGKFKKIEITSSIFSNHNAMRLEINYREKNIKNRNTWRLNNTLLNNQEITEEIKEEIKK